MHAAVANARVHICDVTIHWARPAWRCAPAAVAGSRRFSVSGPSGIREQRRRM